MRSSCCHAGSVSDEGIVTLLSIIGSKSIAVPLSSSFPASELQYILDNSDSLMFLSSAKFQTKAQEALKLDLKRNPICSTVAKRLGGEPLDERVMLEDATQEQGGMMLYTSGTTSRPVRTLGSI